MPASSSISARRYQPDPALVNAAVDAIVRAYQPERIIVFGSFARGDTHELSDLDLIVVKETGERFLHRIGRVRDACAGLGVDVQPFVYTPDELHDLLERGSAFLETALAEGRVVYGAPAT